MLKKQTIWLLTMLSLMIVLSVYYIYAPGSSDELAYVDKQDQTKQNEQEVNKNDDSTVVDDMVGVGESQEYAQKRLDIENARSKQMSRLKDIVASSTATTTEKSVAYDKMDSLGDKEKKENVLEDTILAASDYKDVLVRYDKNDHEVIHIDVKTQKKMSDKEVLNIMQSARDEFGDIRVDVNYDIIDG